MRYVFGFLAFMMILFVGVQYNDPDGPLWMLYYAIPAIWAGIAAFRPDLLAGRSGISLLSVSAIAVVALAIVYWPPVAGWWHEDVWWESEVAREGMGLMIASIILIVVLVYGISSQARTALPRR